MNNKRGRHGRFVGEKPRVTTTAAIIVIVISIRRKRIIVRNEDTYVHARHTAKPRDDYRFVDDSNEFEFLEPAR